MHYRSHLLSCLLIGLLQSATVLSEHAMTTVLARPLGGYGLTPLIFEPSTTMLGLSSNSIETKVRKSPVFEVLMPNYDDESVASFPVTEVTSSADNKSKAPAGKKLDYESLISKNDVDKTVPAPSTNSYFSSSGMFGLFGSGASKSNSLYDEPIPSYKEQISRSDFGKASSYSSSSGPYSNPGPVNAAIQSMRSVEVKNVENLYDNSEPQVIDIAPSALPIVINFRTSSSQIKVNQMHESAEPAEVQQTNSEDAPQYLKHSVTKPVIQEVHEIIMPYRKIIQEIQPVTEEIKTIVARGKPREGSGKAGKKYNGGGGGGGNAGGYGGVGKQSGDGGKYKSKA